VINLFIPYYTDQSIHRQEEIDLCLAYNWQNALIDKIYLVTEDIRVYNNGKMEDEKTSVILIQERPTYNTMFEVINSVTGPEDWNVLINSDIYLDDTIEHIHNFSYDCFLSLSRWDVDKSGNATHFNRWDSQDTWIFKGNARKMNADFYQGTAGCDNAIADRAERAGYRVLNPSKTIKTYHLHNSGARNYNPNNRVPKPYKLITPHE
jgi:hypothetical protein